MNTNQLLNYDQWTAALCLYREARGMSPAGKAAVLAVIRNRTTDPKHRWPRTIHQVVTQPYQFSSFNASDPQVTNWPKEQAQGDWQAFWECVEIVVLPLQADPTGGAQFYYDSSISPPAVAWLGKGKTADDLMKFKTLEIGNLSFFNIP